MTFVFVNGEYCPTLSCIGGLQPYCSFDEGVLHLHLPKRFFSKTPIYFIHMSHATDKRVSRTACRLVLDENSEVMLFESYQGRPDCDCTYLIDMDIDMKLGARLSHYKWQSDSRAARHQAKVRVNQAKDSCLNFYHVVYGGISSQERFDYYLKGERATCESFGLYQANQTQCIEVDSCVHHLSSCTRSRQFYKGTADDQSHAKFHGAVWVSEGLKAIEAHQRNDNLLLSSKAQAKTQPELSIYTDDVLCSHGATVGQLDETALFYLCSRGMDQAVARELLINGFVNAVFDRFPDSDRTAEMRQAFAASSASPPPFMLASKPMNVC